MTNRPSRAWFLGCVLLGACNSGGGGNDSSPTSAGSTNAYRWEVSVATAGPGCLQPNTPLRLTVSVYKRDGELLPNPRYDVASDVSGAIEPDGSGGWTVRGEGGVRITATYAGATEPDAVIAPVAFDLVRDGTAPQIAIFQPARGAMLVSASDLRVQGQVSDATSPVQSVVINGAEQLTSAAGLSYAIDASPPGRWGLNVIEVAATDSCGNSTKHAQSYLRSEQYRPAATVANPAARVPAGQALKLTQEAVDDFDRADLDDAATLVERYLERNLNPALQQASSGFVLASRATPCRGIGYTATITSPGVTAVRPRVRRIELQAEGSRQELSADTITVPLRFNARLPIGVFRCRHRTINVNVALSAAMASTSESTTTVGASGKVGVNLRSLQVDLTGVRISLTRINVIDNLLSSLLGLFAGGVENLVEAQIRDMVPSVLAEFFNAPLTAQAAIHGGPFNLTLNALTGMDGLNVTPAAMTQSAFAQVYPSAAGTPYPSQGAIVRQTSVANLASNPGPVTYAIDDNLINQGLWTLWYGGALEIPDLIGFPGATLRVSALLPPVLMPGTRAGDAALGLGDLKVTLNLNLDQETLPPVVGRVQVEAYASVLVEGAIQYDGVAGRLLLRHEPGSGRAYVQFQNISDGTHAITDEFMLARIREYSGELIARFIEQLADGTLVSALLPPLRFAFAQPVAGGTIDTLEIRINAVSRTADHVVIDMSLRAEEPPEAQLDGTLTFNHPWSRQNLIDLGIPDRLLDKLTYRDEPAHSTTASPTITVRDYRRSTRPECESAGSSGGKPICLTDWKFPLDYGWYCGAGRPVVGFLGNPALDPVDYCCRLHDQNLFDPKLESLSPANACGFAMCLRQATTSVADITARLPDVERARQQMYDKAALLCEGIQPRLPPPEIVP